MCTTPRGTEPAEKADSLKDGARRARSSLGQRAPRAVKRVALEGRSGKAGPHRKAPDTASPGVSSDAESKTAGLSDRAVFTTRQAADYLGSISPRTLDTMRSRGGGPVFVKLGRRVAYRKRDLDQWLDSSARRISTSSASTRNPTDRSSQRNGLTRR